MIQQEKQVIDRLKQLISERIESYLLVPEGLKEFNKYQALVNKYEDAKGNRSEYDSWEEYQDDLNKIQKRICKLLSIKVDSNNRISDHDNKNVLFVMISREDCHNLNCILSYSGVRALETNKERAEKWQAILERAEICLKEEKYYTIEPLVTIGPDLVQGEYEGDKVFYAKVIIINNTSFIKLIVEPNRIKQRVERTIRRDIREASLENDSQVHILFQGIRELEKLELNSYKEAKALQQNIIKLRDGQRHFSKR